MTERTGANAAARQQWPKKSALLSFAGDMLEQFQSARIDLPLRNRVAQRAPRFLPVAAVVKAALAEILRKFHEALLYAAKAQVMQSKGLHAGAVDQCGFPVDAIKPGMGRGVLARIQRRRGLARGRLCAG